MRQMSKKKRQILKKMKAAVSVILICSILFSSLPIFAQAADTGSGTAASGIVVITTAAELAAIPSTGLDKSYRLGQNIDLSGYGDWSPIGDDKSPFTGAFDGNGHKITGLKIGSEASPNTALTYAGLFGYIKGAAVKNVDLSADIYTNGAGYSGGISGAADSAYVFRCNVNGNLIDTATDSQKSKTVGGIVGESINNSQIDNCTVNCTVSCFSEAGGIAGYSKNSVVINCSTNGTVSAMTAGGIIGDCEKSTVLNCHAKSEVKSQCDAGGLIGYNDNTNITLCSAEGNVKCAANASNIGGFIGSNNDSNIQDSYSSGNITGGSEIGGFIGVNYVSGNVYIRNCYSTGNVTGTYSCGGFIGYDDGENLTISECHATGTVKCTGYYAGGFIGFGYKELIHDCYSTGDVYGDYDVGGLIGYSFNKIIHCHSTGNVTSTNQTVGGLIGHGDTATIINSYSCGNVQGIRYCGGLAGELNTGSVTNCYADGNINASSNYSDTEVGGLIGTCDNSSIKKSYSKCNITADLKSSQCALIGGLIGNFSGGTNGTISNSFATGNLNLTINGSSNVNSNESIIGGLIGENYGNILNCYTTGNITTIDSNEGYSYVGGLIGLAEDHTISNCYSSGTVDASLTNVTHPCVGSCFGSLDDSSNSKATISNCYYNSANKLPVAGSGDVSTTPTGMSIPTMQTSAFASTLNGNIKSLSLTDCVPWISEKDKNNNLPTLLLDTDNSAQIEAVGNPSIGNKTESYTDLSADSVGINTSFDRIYDSADNTAGSFGRGWSFSYEGSVSPFQFSYTDTSGAKQTATLPDVKVVKLPDGTSCAFQLIDGVYYSDKTRDTLVQNTDGTYTLTQKDKTKYTFNASGYLTAISDRNGNTVSISVGANGKIQSVTDTAGRVFKVACNSGGYISSITAPTGRTVQYSYQNGNLSSVKDPAGAITAQYTYDASGYLSKISDAYGNVEETTVYDHSGGENDGRILSSADSKNQVTNYLYDNSSRTETETDAQGNQTVTTFDSSNRTVKTANSQGTSAYAYADTYGDILSETDSSGTTSYKYDANGNQIQVVNADGTTKTDTYDENSNLLTSEDGNGNTTYYTYDSNGNELIEAQPKNRIDVYSPTADQSKFIITKNEYNSNGTVSKTTDSDGTVTAYTYDHYGNVIKENNSASGVTRSIYDEMGNLLQQIDPSQYSAAKDGLNKSPSENTYGDSNIGDRYTYNADGKVLTQTDAQGNTTGNVYDGNQNLVKTVSNKDTTRYVYNKKGRLVQQIPASQYNASNDGLNSVSKADTYSDNSVGVRYTYDNYGNVKTCTDSSGTGTVNYYDSTGNLIKTVAGSKVTRCLYYSNGRLRQEIYPDEYNPAYDGLNDASPQNTYGDSNVGDRYTYDATGNILTHIDGNNVTSSYVYNSSNKVIKYTHGGRVTRYVYNAGGKLIQQISPSQYNAADDGLSAAAPADTYSDSSAGNRYTYDTNGNKATHTDPAGNVMYYTYDNDNNLIKTVCNSKVTRYVYDINNRLIQKIYPAQYKAAADGLDGSDFDNTYSDKTVGDRYTYDANGNKLTYTDSGNTTTYYTYNSSNNLIKSVCADKSTRYLYDSQNRLIQQINPEQYKAADDGLNKTPSENTYSDGNVGDRYTYDSNGNALTHTGSDNSTVTYKYNADGKLLSENTPDGSVYTYDSGSGNVTAETYSNGVTNTTEYNDDGTVFRVTGSNGVSTRLSYDNGNVSTYTLKAGKTEKATAYTYDADGNIQTISESGSQKERYYYDVSDQLVREDSTVQNATTAYTYDADGNITAKTVYPYTVGSLSAATSTSTCSYQYADATDKDRLTSYNGKAITYGTDGNINTYDGWSFTWTGSGLSGLKSADKTISYEYNSEGCRTKKTVGDVTTAYTLDGGQLQSETDGKNTIKYYYSSSGSPVYLTINGTAYIYEKNMQGDIIGLLDSGNNEVVTYTYDSWGKLLNIGGKLASTVGVENPIRYRGYYYDTETGLYYLQSRYYNPEWGRFISQDDGSYHEDMTGAKANLWGYANNNAVMNSDPTGRWVLAIGIEGQAAFVVGILVGIGINVDQKLNVSITYSIGFMIVTNVVANVAGYVTYYYNKNSVSQLNGWGASVGIAWSMGLKLSGSTGLDFSLSGGKIGGNVSMSLGIGVSAAPIPYWQVTIGYTGTLYQFNLRKVISHWNNNRTKSFSSFGFQLNITKKPHKVLIYTNSLDKQISLKI